MVEFDRKLFGVAVARPLFRRDPQRYFFLQFRWRANCYIARFYPATWRFAFLAWKN